MKVVGVFVVLCLLAQVQALTNAAFYKRWKVMHVPLVVRDSCVEITRKSYFGAGLKIRERICDQYTGWIPKNIKSRNHVHRLVQDGSSFLVKHSWQTNYTDQVGTHKIRVGDKKQTYNEVQAFDQGWQDSVKKKTADKWVIVSKKGERKVKLVIQHGRPIKETVWIRGQRLFRTSFSF